MSRYPASTVASVTLLVPVIGILTAWLVRGEHPTWGELRGSLVVLNGLALALGVVDALPVPRRAADRTAPSIQADDGDHPGSRRHAGPRRWKEPT